MKSTNTFIRIFNYYILRRQASFFFFWKNFQQQLKTKKNLACKQMAQISSKIAYNYNNFTTRQKFMIWKQTSFTGSKDPKLEFIMQELETTKLKANSYYSELIKLKKYNSFLFAKYGK